MTFAIRSIPIPKNCPFVHNRPVHQNPFRIRQPQKVQQIDIFAGQCKPISVKIIDSARLGVRFSCYEAEKDAERDGVRTPEP